MSPAIELESLRFAWRRGAPPLLEIDALTLARGERLFLHGPSGSGKSTLINLLAGVLTPAAGRLEVLGTALPALRGAARDRFRADHIGLVFQQFNLLPWLTVAENVELPCRFSKPRRQRAGDLPAAVRRLLAALELDGMAGQRVGTLSVGQQQRVALARALIGTPELIIADEPTSALDQERRDAFLELLFEQAAAAGSSVLFVSHDRTLAGRFDRSVALAELNGSGAAAGAAAGVGAA